MDGIRLIVMKVEEYPVDKIQFWQVRSREAPEVHSKKEDNLGVAEGTPVVTSIL